MSKKLINSVDSCVDEGLQGLADAHPQLRLHPRHRVMLDAHVNERRKVAVISGGGAGHEPFAAGYVGPGMLTAAVSGSVFASPPSNHIMHAIRSAATFNPDGVFVVIPNYTGDILNFGLSVELARSQGIKIDSIVVGEDIALESYGVKTRAGKRGMCGLVVLFKILGHLSSKGESLASLKSVATAVTQSMASIGLGLTACSLPGAGPLFQLAEDEVELGVGVHGEAGVQRLKLRPAKEVVAIFIKHLAEFFKLTPGDEICAFVNNLGALTNLEQWLIAKEVKEQLTVKGIRVTRLYAGSIFTSLNMAGVQVCLLKLSPESRRLILEALDEPTAAPAWPGCGLSVPGDKVAVGGEEEDEEEEVERGPKISEVESEVIKRCVLSVTEVIVKEEARLNYLDSGCGDGDCGTTLRHLSQEIQNCTTRGSLFYHRPAGLAAQLAGLAQRTMGGTSGALYSLLFTSASAQLEVQTDLQEAKVWGAVWKAGLQGMKKYSLARIGDRTMFDALEPACNEFIRSLESGSRAVDALQAAASAAERGCASTSDMKALAGRASYVEKSQLKEVDAGAYAVSVWLKALFVSFQK